MGQVSRMFVGWIFKDQYFTDARDGRGGILAGKERSWKANSDLGESEGT